MRKRLLSALGALTLAGSLALSPAQADQKPTSGGAPAVVSPAPAERPNPAETVRVTRAGGVPVQVPVSGGQVSREVRALNADGSIKLLIPKGFSEAAVPEDLDAFAGSITLGKVPSGGAPAVHAHSETHRHTSAYLWNGTVADPNRRDTWLFDRTAPEMEDDVRNMVIEINHGLRPSMQSEQGIPQNWSPAHAYYDNDANDGQCQRGGWAYTNYSFMTMCTSYNLQLDCGGGAGCAYVYYDSGHNGPRFQPSAFVGSGFGPVFRQNAVRHEIGHTIGWGHNQGESESIMAPVQPTWYYTRITYHDTWDLSNKYRHAPDTCC